MLPPAPARFSTTTVWPNFTCMWVARMRAKRSAEPPAPNGTTMVICLAGQSWAQAGAAPTSPAIKAANNRRMRPHSPEPGYRLWACPRTVFNATCRARPLPSCMTAARYAGYNWITVTGRKRMALEFGIFDHVDRHDQPLKDFYEDRLKLIEAYDRAGIYGYHCAEHHSTPLGMAPSRACISPRSANAPSGSVSA